MLWLPELAESGGGRRLPLADASAAGLLAVVAGGAAPDSVKLLSDVLAHDAALALWVVQSAAAAGRDGLRSVAELAQWLAEHVRAVLVWPSGCQQAPDDAAWLERCRRLAARSVAVAQLAGERDDEAYLIGLLHAADEWWALDPRFAERGDGELAVGPGWLAAALDRLREPAAAEGREATARVARAVQVLDDSWEPPAPRAFDRRLEAAKLSALAEFAAGAGHEINNPIAVIAGRAQLLLDGESHPQRRRELAVINSQAMRVYEMITDMMLFARPPAPHRAPCDMTAVARQVVSEIDAQARERQVRVSLEAPAGPAIVTGDATQLAVALRAICDNALAAVDRGGQVEVRVARTAGGDQLVSEPVAITVSDTGPGVSAEVREHLFDPFYCGRPAGRGLGMGLAKAWRLVSGHRGRIDVESPPGQGARFTIVLPG